MTEEKQHTDDDEIDYRKRTTPFTINISRALQRRITLAAEQNDLSVDEYVEHILEENVPGEGSTTQRKGRPVTRKTLEAFRQIQEEIMKDRNGRPFEEDSTEMLRRAREERTRELMGEL